MQSLVQPGPVHPQRIDSFTTSFRHLRYTLQPGVSLNEAISTPLVAAGFRSAAVRFTGGTLAPFRYVIPGPPDDASHVAYFSAPHAPPGETRIEHANATFGWLDGAPFVHCHAAWMEADGSARGGHILPGESAVSGATTVEAWGSVDIAIAATFDPETNFRLLQPVEPAIAGEGRCVVARVKPNEDITLAVEQIAHRHGLANADVRGSLGSLVGAGFVGGAHVADHATEVLVCDGSVRDGVAKLDLIVIDMRGEVHRGTLERGRNAVCITFELFLQES